MGRDAEAQRADINAVLQEPIAYHGLPAAVRFCTRCVMSNQRPNSCVEHANHADIPKQTIHFDDEGVCDACRVAEAKKSIDWTERERELKDLLAEHRSDGAYDCIVPGSGGKDSFYAAHILKTKYGMHPLLVTWAPHLYTDVGWRNLVRWQAIADHILVTPSTRIHRFLTRLALENLFHPFQPFVIGQKNLAPKIASIQNIPLVFYGENEAEYGNCKETAKNPLRDKSFSTPNEEIYLGGCSLSELDAHGITRGDLQQYLPESQAALESTQIHYLGYYLKWHPQSAYYYAVEHGGFECAPERTPGTYSKYNSIDDKIDDLHYWTTFIKFGIGRATYDAAQEIRSGEITREEGISLVRRYDGEWPARFENDLYEYLSVPGFPPMDRKYLMNLANQFRSPHLWECMGPYGNWVLRHVVR